MLLEMKGLLEWLWMQAGACLYRGENLQQGSKSIHLGSRNEEKPNGSENLIFSWEFSGRFVIQSSEGEAADVWADRPIGGASWPYLLPPHRDFLHGGF